MLSGDVRADASSSGEAVSMVSGDVRADASSSVEAASVLISGNHVLSSEVHADFFITSCKYIGFDMRHLPPRKVIVSAFNPISAPP
jgi:hypothetical protein